MNPMSDETKRLVEKHLSLHGTSIIATAGVMFSQNGYKVEPINPDSKNIWEAGLCLSKDDNKGDVEKMEYFFHNTFVEIFCVDRDDDPLIFDEKIENDFMYTVGKIASVLDGRFILICGVLEGKDIKEIYEENSNKYERMRKKIVNADDIDGATF